MLFTSPIEKCSALQQAIVDAYIQDEAECVKALMATVQSFNLNHHAIHDFAYQLVKQIRLARQKNTGLDSFIYEYNLSSEEGITLMCLAEAYLRIPDVATVDRLLKDKISAADWKARLKNTDNFWVNAASWGLILTGKLLSLPDNASGGFTGVLKRLISRSGEPFIRTAVQKGMKILGQQFVMGDTIESALKRAKAYEKKGYRYSYDMLGEGAKTSKDAERYFIAYQNAIREIGKFATHASLFLNPSISVKLSALHPRYELSQQHLMQEELIDRVRELAYAAKSHNITLTLDAEESYRLDFSLEIFKAVFADPQLSGWNGLGLAVQAYQKRAPHVIAYLAELARQYKRKIPLRLVKGAYWDTEIKRAQVQGLADYPVFTRKTNTDISYIACAGLMIQNAEAFFPQFATHNANTVATILELMPKGIEYEFQCLHGMGHSLYDFIVGKDNLDLPCRIYAPVGNYQDLLPYLIRRLLENSANTSFVNQIVDEKTPIESLLMNPVQQAQERAQIRHPKIPLPRNLYGESRINSEGLDLTNWSALKALQQGLIEAQDKTWIAEPLVANASTDTYEQEHIVDPACHHRTIGVVGITTERQVQQALHNATSAMESWREIPASTRADYLDRMAQLLEEHKYDLLYLLIREAGKTLPDAIGEVREAVDFCRYYAKQARTALIESERLIGPTGELNQLSLHGRGTIICISPWNFPLAIFLGQITASLVAGNCVIAKPSEQTPLIAYYAVKLLHQAGFPEKVIQLTPGGGTIGELLTKGEGIQGVLFTGSTNTAVSINRTLAHREGPIVQLIAETGGQNAMLVDSSALAEQVVTDVLLSAFGSAGQRCSALRVLFLQQDIADKIIEMLIGAAEELRVGDPALLETDIGPVIDKPALTRLQNHFQALSQTQKVLYRAALPKQLTDQGTFFPPTIIEIENLSLLKQEVFGPILHVIRYDANRLDDIIEQIRNTGYGLTLGIHSRIQKTVNYIQKRLPVGNTYVNRNMIGAVVGVQPFGGECLSGTGPKAGGPHYLTRLCVERTLTINTTAAGGDTTLLSLQEE